MEMDRAHSARAIAGPNHRMPAIAQRGGDILRMRTALDRVDRPKPHAFQGRVVQLPAIAIPHTRIVPELRDQVSLLTTVLVT